MKRIGALTSLLLLTSCSSGTWKSDALGVEMEVPRGYDKPKESGNTADFGRGLFVVRVDEQLPALGSVPHDDLAAAAIKKLPREVPATTITSRREGTIGAAKTVRFDLKDGPSRAILYVIPSGSRYFAVYAASQDSAALDRVERSIGTLRIR